MGKSLLSGHSSRLPCGHCGDGVHQGTGMIYDHKNKKNITCVVCNGSGWIYIPNK